MLQYNRTQPDRYGCDSTGSKPHVAGCIYTVNQAFVVNGMLQLVYKVNTVMRMIETARRTDSNCSLCQLHSCGFQWIPVPFWWIPADSGHSCRNIRGIEKYCPLTIINNY